jgi:hypothetical protein
MSTYRRRPVSYALIATRLLRAIGGRAKNRHQFGLCYLTDGGSVPHLAYEGVDRAIAHGQIIMNDDGSIELSSVAKEFEPTPEELKEIEVKHVRRFSRFKVRRTSPIFFS